MGYPIAVEDPARRHLVRDHHEGEVQPLLLFSAPALTSDGVCSSSTAEGSETAEADRAESFVGPTELGEYDSDREDGEIMQEYMTRRARQWNGIIAGGLGVGVPKGRFAEVLLEGSRLSEDEKRRVFAGVTLLLQGAASETQPWTCAMDAMQSHEEVMEMRQSVEVR